MIINLLKKLIKNNIKRQYRENRHTKLNKIQDLEKK